MQTILKNNKYIYEIKHSKFIGFLSYTDNKESSETFLNTLHKKYPDATHIVYAYRFTDGQYRFSDANEPKNSAGKPLYNVINKRDLYNITIAVIRYFGGVKLGIGGLVRAYSRIASELIKTSIMNKLIKSYICSLAIDYSSYNNFRNFIKSKNEISISNEQFEELIHLRFICSPEIYSVIEKLHYIKDIKKTDTIYFAF